MKSFIPDGLESVMYKGISSTLEEGYRSLGWLDTKTGRLYITRVGDEFRKAVACLKAQISYEPYKSAYSLADAAFVNTSEEVSKNNGERNEEHVEESNKKRSPKCSENCGGTQGSVPGSAQVNSGIDNTTTCLNHETEHEQDAIRVAPSYIPVTAESGREEQEVLFIPDLKALQNFFVEEHYIHREDRDDFLRIFSLEFIREIFGFSKETRVSYRLRFLTNDAYVWHVVEFLKPQNYGEDFPYVVFGIRAVDSSSVQYMDTMREIGGFFYGIFRCRIPDMQIFTVQCRDCVSMENYPVAGITVQKWSQNYMSKRPLHPDDIQKFLDFFSEKAVQDFANSNAISTFVRFRILEDGFFRWTQAEFCRTAVNRGELILYLRDIDDTYKVELQHREELEFLISHDTLTGLYNRRYFGECCRLRKRNGELGPVGLVFCDLNGLKYVNDTGGHSCGDEFIRCFVHRLQNHFRDYLCFRMSGDEFVVLTLDIDRVQFENLVVNFRSAVMVDGKPLAAVGYAWDAQGPAIGELMRKAETVMYTDKNRAHVEFPEFVRSYESQGISADDYEH